MLKIVNLVSGSGSTNLAIIQAESLGGKLDGLVKTGAIILSDPASLERIKEKGFPAKDIWVVESIKGDLASQLLEILDKYKPDYFHQLGWMPKTPREVIKRYEGLNQHLGPGGKWMYGVRRIYAHMRFCETIGEKRPISIFCQKVAPEYDEGQAIFIQYEDIFVGETPEVVAKRLLPIEHQVQIEALYRLATNSFKLQPVPKLANNLAEERILSEIKKEARDKYSPRDTKTK
jgi:folate-dependent phosphoribosylglycinamide formyltransferase PurN